MVRFSCFNTHANRHRSKKTLDNSSKRVKEYGFTSKSLISVIYGRSNASGNAIGKPTGSTALDRGWKSEEIKANVNLEHDIETHQVMHLKKSQSHGDVFYLNGRDATENDTDDGVDHMTSPDSVEQNGFIEPGSSKLVEGSPSGLYQKAPLNSVSILDSSDQALNGSIFSVGDPHHADKDIRQLEDSSFSGERVDDSNGHSPRTSPMMVRSSSMPNIAGRSSPLKYSSVHFRSSDDVRVLDMWQKEKSFLETDTEAMLEQDRDHGMHKSGGNNVESFIDDGYDGYGYSSLAKDWIVPVIDEPKLRVILQGESSKQQLEFSSKDFKIKRIEEWVNDLQHVSLPDEADESPEYDDETPREPIVLSGSTAKVDLKLNPGMEVAKKYISSLSASSTTAQLVNHGLVVIPFLSAFVGLRVLNLSGNAIVRITAGALPRGLHVLNLSKNSISTIEGLRELTRLRVLDLSYNRILRIGHGLASCSSLKELYLAGNKISEVEGLHRLLKLIVLDLRFNKISTAKCLGQLAANYNSLQAISLEGNPAQKNVGDEQLKKYLLGLLPNLAYFNRHAIKDASDRRLGVSTHQLERGHRSELKNSSRKSSLGAANVNKPSASVTARRTQAGALQKRSKDRSNRLPPAGQKGSAAAAAVHRNRYAAIDSRLSSLRSDLSMRRSRSEGTLGAF